jgi:hypothetical protein
MASRTCFGVSFRPLVVDTVGFNDQVNIDAGGHPHSGELRTKKTAGTDNKLPYNRSRLVAQRLPRSSRLQLRCRGRITPLGESQCGRATDRIGNENAFATSGARRPSMAKPPPLFEGGNEVSWRGESGSCRDQPHSFPARGRVSPRRRPGSYRSLRRECTLMAVVAQTGAGVPRYSLIQHQAHGGMGQAALLTVALSSRLAAANARACRRRV